MRFSIFIFKELIIHIDNLEEASLVSGNYAVLEIENQIKENLKSLKLGFEEDLTDKSLIELQKLLEDTRKLVINRETLNIK
ncbi:hypothetical protein [uncultured Clostridium sp.]|uniref:hypothetical protein n=1 Tax=uncultured Clostridium sp. TaxID=59620 RepID=UPI0032173805